MPILWVSANPFFGVSPRRYSKGLSGSFEFGWDLFDFVVTLVWGAHCRLCFHASLYYSLISINYFVHCCGS